MSDAVTTVFLALLFVEVAFAAWEVRNRSGHLPIGLVVVVLVLTGSLLVRSWINDIGMQMFSEGGVYAVTTALLVSRFRPHRLVPGSLLEIDDPMHCELHDEAPRRLGTVWVVLIFLEFLVVAFVAP